MYLLATKRCNNLKMFLRICSTSGVLGLSLLIAAPAFAQSLTLTSPTQGLSVAEGDDFASGVLQNPWDMSQRRDIGFEENFQGQSIQSQNGIWSGLNSGGAGYVFPLFGGFAGSLDAEGLPEDLELPRYGTKHPIDSNKYYLLSYRLRHSSRGTYAIYWGTPGGPTHFPDGSKFRSNYDGFFLDQGYFNNDFLIYSFDLRGANFDILTGDWAGSINALRIDPSISAGNGARTDIDWIRLVDPASAPQLKINWQSNGIPSGALITVWAQSATETAAPLARYINDGQGRTQGGSNYTTRATPPSSTGTHNLPTAMLPPGRYTFFVTAHVANAGVLFEVARSSVSSALTVLPRPRVTFSAPAQDSGEDYASSELSNPWDMADASDVANLPGSGLPYSLMQFLNPSFAAGLFQATSDVPLPNSGNSQGDAQVHLNISASRPISSAKYRYLTYRMGADESLFPTIQKKVSEGWVARPVFWGADLFGDGASTQAHVLFEGMHTYTIDLWDNSIIERGIGWRSIPLIRHLRLDPLETTIPTWFFLDFAKLTAENYPQNNRYTIRWKISDTTQGGLSTALYYDRDDKNFDGTLIAQVSNLSPGSQSYNWDTSSLQNGRYFIYAVVSDGSNVSRSYSAAPVVVGPAISSNFIGKAPLDFDGDGKSDPVIFRPAKNSTFWIRASTAGLINRNLGDQNAVPIEGDFDGDGKADVSVVQSTPNGLLWTTVLSSNGSVSNRYWGVNGDQPAIADYDGDSTDDVAVYRGGLWYVLFRDGRVAVAAWGEPTDIPAPADFDGDSKADFAIWRPRDGTWWVVNSGFGAGLSPQYKVVQWGLPGDIPLPADFDNDRKADFIVWRPSNGTWYWQSNASQATASWQWGLPGDIPLIGDFNGDQQLDLCVYRPLGSNWFINDRISTQSVTQWGLPSDRISK